MGRQHDGHEFAVDILHGAIAGGLATAALGAVTSYLYEHEDPGARRREDRARGGRSAYEVAADRLAGAAGAALTRGQRSALGEGVHYATGVGAGAAYGAVRRSIPWPAPLRGLAFGAALWLVADEGLTPALGLTPGPRAFPWQAHARGLSAHLVFGLVAEAALSALDAAHGRLVAPRCGPALAPHSEPIARPFTPGVSGS